LLEEISNQLDQRFLDSKKASHCGWLFYVQGWTVFRKEPGMAVRLCPGMDCIPQRARDGGAVMSRDGLAENCSCNICTSTIRGGRQIFAPAISALPPSVVVVFRNEPGMAMRTNT
jgi:hypothetical protein